MITKMERYKKYNDSIIFMRSLSNIKCDENNRKICFEFRGKDFHNNLPYIPVCRGNSTDVDKTYTFIICDGDYVFNKNSINIFEFNLLYTVRYYNVL